MSEVPGAGTPQVAELAGVTMQAQSQEHPRAEGHEEAWASDGQSLRTDERWTEALVTS